LTAGRGRARDRRRFGADDGRPPGPCVVGGGPCGRFLLESEQRAGPTRTAADRPACNQGTRTGQVGRRGRPTPTASRSIQGWRRARAGGGRGGVRTVLQSPRAGGPNLRRGARRAASGGPGEGARRGLRRRLAERAPAQCVPCQTARRAAPAGARGGPGGLRRGGSVRAWRGARGSRVPARSQRASPRLSRRGGEVRRGGCPESQVRRGRARPPGLIAHAHPLRGARRRAARSGLWALQDVEQCLADVGPMPDK
jgi:hypothetical protein